MDDLLRELVASVSSSDASPEVGDVRTQSGEQAERALISLQMISDSVLRELKDCFLEAYDENADGRIEIGEVRCFVRRAAASNARLFPL